jgi:hypothetical protein
MICNFSPETFWITKFGFGVERMVVRETVKASHEDTKMSSKLHHYRAAPFYRAASCSTVACR